MKRFFKRLFKKNREVILQQVLEIKGLMRLLMKHRNTGEKWTREEIRMIKMHLKAISRLVPTLIIFFLPGGSLLLPFLAKILDRRKTKRPADQKI